MDFDDHGNPWADQTSGYRLVSCCHGDSICQSSGMSYITAVTRIPLISTNLQYTLVLSSNIIATQDQYTDRYELLTAWKPTVSVQYTPLGYTLLPLNGDTFLQPLGTFSASLSTVLLKGSSRRRATSPPSAWSSDFGAAVSTTSEICDGTWQECRCMIIDDLSNQRATVGV